MQRQTWKEHEALSSCQGFYSFIKLPVLQRQGSLVCCRVYVVNPSSLHVYDHVYSFFPISCHVDTAAALYIIICNVVDVHQPFNASRHSSHVSFPCSFFHAILSMQFLFMQYHAHNHA